MKKITILSVALLLIISLCGCSMDSNTQPVSKSDTEIAAESAIAVIKSKLKNPSSLIVNSVSYVTEPCTRDCDKYKDNVNNFQYLYAIDISAQNGFGGMNREVYYAQYRENGEIVLYNNTSDGLNFTGKYIELYYNIGFGSVYNIDVSKLTY